MTSSVFVLVVLVCTGFVLAVSHWEVFDPQQDFGGLGGVDDSHQTDTSESSSRAHEIELDGWWRTPITLTA